METYSVVGEADKKQEIFSPIFPENGDPFIV